MAGSDPAKTAVAETAKPGNGERAERPEPSSASLSGPPAPPAGILDGVSRLMFQNNLMAKVCQAAKVFRNASDGVPSPVVGERFSCCTFSEGVAKNESPPATYLAAFEDLLLESNTIPA